MKIYNNTLRGFTLIEMMIALAIGMVIMLAVGALFISSRQSSSAQLAFARVQENGRFGTEWLNTYIRNAGVRARVESDPSVVFPAATPFTGHVYTSKSVIRGRELSASDELSVRLEGSTERPVMDCNGVLVPVAGGASPLRLNLRFYRSATTRQVLCDSSFSGNAQVIAENVVDMQLVYGQDTKPTFDGMHTRYVNATAVTTGGTWDQVVSVRMCLTVASAATNSVLEKQTYDTCTSTLANAPVPFTAADYRLYKNFISLVNVRNAGAE